MRASDPALVRPLRTPKRSSAPRRTTLRSVDTPPTRPFEVIESKIQPPRLRAGAVSRTALVNRLRVAAWTPVMTVCAPAGYGKTTLLAQWAARDARPFAWVTADERDDDPVVLLRHIAAALDTARPLDPRVLDALRSSNGSIWRSAIPRLGSSVRSLRPSFVLVVDDSHLLRSRESLQALAALADHIPEGSRLVLAGRTMPRLPIPALRANGQLLEIGRDELALSRREAQLLVHETGVDLSVDYLAELVTRCEGWAAALYLAALALRDTGTPGMRNGRVAFRGDDVYVADYVRLEYLSGLRPGTLRFLRRTSVLERLCGPLCDAVLGDEGSSRQLQKIERANLFLVPLDHRRDWYRYQHLFRDLLQRELRESEPELVPILHSRAADWYEAHDEPEAALEHAAAAGDIERTARILTAIALPVYHRGRAAVVEARLEQFEDEGLLDRFPGVALQGAWIHTLRGRATKAERWLRAAENGAFDGVLPDGCTSLHPWLAVLRAAMCRDGAQQMRADAEKALDELPGESLVRPWALIVLGVAKAMLGEPATADGILAQAADEAHRSGATDAGVAALSERSLIAIGQDDPTAAEACTSEAQGLVEQADLGAYATSALALATSARAHLRHGKAVEAKAELEKAERLCPVSAASILPWFAAQVRLELARTYLALRDARAARRLLAEITKILRQWPQLGVLSDHADALRADVDAFPETAASTCVLSAAELRLLPLLATHLSFREIGERLYISRNTVKTQAISVYRKLGVSNRSDAITECDRLGLIDLASVSAEAFAT